MKRISYYALIFAALNLCVNVSDASHHPIVIAGLDAAKQYHGQSRQPIFIRTGSFSRKSNAEHAQASLKARLNYPVNMAYKHGYYTVNIGPIASASAARKIAALVPTEVTPAPPTTKSEPPIVVQPTPSVEKVTQPASQPNIVYKKSSEAFTKVMQVFQRDDRQADWDSSFYINGGVGDMFNRVEGNNTLGTGAGWPPDKYVTQGITDQPYFSLGAGYAFARHEDLLPFYSFGLKMIYVSTGTITGFIDQYSLPAFRNYNFQYDIQLFNVMAAAKADIYRWNGFMPYVTGAVGLTNYHTSQYTEHAASNVTPRVSPAFGAGTGDNFSYGVGVGLDYILLQNLWINLEYNYVSFGEVSTDNGQNYATLTGTNYDNEALKNNIAATSLFVGLTYYVS